MADLKPRLIITQRGRKRRGFGKLLLVLIIFAVGFYSGSRYGDVLFEYLAPENDVSVNKVSATDDIVQEQPVNEDPAPMADTRISGSQVKQEPGGYAAYTDSSLAGDAEFDSPVSFDNDERITTGVIENKLILGEDSGASQEISFILDNDITGDISDDEPQNKSSYTLQVGAFSTSEEAEGIADGYLAKGYKAYVVPIENSRGEKWNLVKIGRFNTIEQAWSYSTYFKNREGLDAYVETLEQDTVFNESWNNFDNAERE